MGICTASLGGRPKLTVAVALTAAILLSGTSCAKDETPPVVQQYEMPEWVVENENIDLKVNTFDDQKTRKVYIQFPNGDVIDLIKTYSKQIESGEESIWEAKDLKLSPEKYSFQIVASDSVNFSEPKTVNITVYPNDGDGDGIGYRDEIKYGIDVTKKNPVSKYLLDKNLGIYLPMFTYLENDEWMTDSEKSFIDLAIAYHPKISQILPGFDKEILKLPDFSTIGEKDVEAVEDIFILASNPKYKTVFESMLNVGIPEKRKYCSSLQALLWIAYDKEFDELADDLLEPYSTEKLVKYAWTNTSISRNYESDRWQEFDEVVDRLNSPELATIYCIDNIPYDQKKLNAFMATGRLQPMRTPQETFIEKTGACMDQSNFIVYLLRKNGYGPCDTDLYKNDVACRMQAGTYSEGHDTCLYVQDGKIYVIDVANPFSSRGIKGPVKRFEDAASITWPGWCMSALWDFDPSWGKPSSIRFVNNCRR